MWHTYIQEVAPERPIGRENKKRSKLYVDWRLGSLDMALGSEGKSSLGGSSKYSMFVYFPKFSYIPLKLRYFLTPSNPPKIRLAMFTEDGNIVGYGIMFLGNLRGLQT